MHHIKIACAAIWIAEGVYRQLQFVVQYFPACGDLALGDIVWYTRKNGVLASMPPIVTNGSTASCRRRSAVAPTALSPAAAAVRMKCLVCCFNCCQSLAPMYHGTLKSANNAVVSSGIMPLVTQRACTCEEAASADRVAACYLVSVAGYNIACCGVRCWVPLPPLLNSVKCGPPFC